MASKLSQIITQGLRIPGNDLALAQKQDEQGDMLSIALIQPANAQAKWLIEVFAVTEQGKFRVGDVWVPPPFGSAPPPQDPPSRLVASAFYPGVKEWQISARADRVFNAQTETFEIEVADIVLTSSPCASGSVPGVFACRQGGSNENGSRFFFDVPPTAATLVLDDVATFGGDPQLTLRLARGTVTSGAAIAGNLTIQFFDKVAAPVGGDVPFARFDIIDTQRNWVFDFRPYGHQLKFGLAFGLSAQYATYSAPAAGQVSDANIEIAM